MIIPSDKSYTHLTIKSYIHYDLSIFYSSAHITWMIGLLRIKVLKPPNIAVIFTRHSTQSLQYYLVTEHSRLIYLNVSVGLVNGSMILRDGPGRLLRVMYKLGNTNSPSYIKRRTSEFLAFLEIIMPYNYSTVSKIRLAMNNSADKVPN